ncbi:MAG: 30S ribosomal protein S9 [Patescibacteria group bacterium]
MLKTAIKKSTLKHLPAQAGKPLGRSPMGEAIEPIKEMPELTKITPVQNIEEEDDFSSEDFKIEKDLASKPDRYFEAIGRRKTAVARVRLFTRGAQAFLINGKPYQEYFLLEEDRQLAVSSMKKMKCLDKFRVSIIVKGGGHHAQAEAVRHGTARVLVDFNNNFRKRLRKSGYLTRDPRMRERKKFGLKRARKSPQWSKR